MSDNIVAIYGDVPELVEKQSAEIISQFLKSDRDDFNFVKY
ncbi:DNA polymerase III subunit delta, partial [Staphylococcus aureus]|nr:DNA polymerase III subunit delta [Staphylococcus aureus]